ncbi:hypothetical protein EYZ11_011315 [Aspergillus tanneri]|uniref:Endo-chitosanase n=1 Tax=Aspergillus tanneri TaxID=1220188 RepID=A0A4S3J594_9EURO|nr:uncharacterized protein ATNIH1004_003723 [Aspergillus tanneri]KAA8651030.1 hypothetical protein ATNIH1004_003723 [Aspergillus tanneri]THC89237.1 hypothetical protein EYZ11_011315 [Aspergillus tanneri]
MRFSEIAAVALATGAAAYDVPDNLKQIYEKHKSGKCSDELSVGFDNGHDHDGHTFTYCGDIHNAIYLHSSEHGGQYVDMDIDCDGANRHAGKCSDDHSGRSETAFMDDLKEFGIEDLDANIHPYVVFGNENKDSPDDRFDPRDHGMEPLSVMAVVCNNKLFYGIWGDTNGHTSTGESSLSMAELCFPEEDPSGDSGHTANDVLYIGFKGKDAVPGKSAKWKANSTKEFEESIRKLGDQLVEGLKA